MGEVDDGRVNIVTLLLWSFVGDIPVTTLLQGFRCVGLDSFVLLALDENKISVIEDNAFGDLTKLEFLNMFNNNITTIKNSTFTGLTNLEYLYLSYNGITTIEDHAFSGLTNIIRLRLNNNRISSIKNITISGLTNLQELRIQDNPYHCDCELIGLVDFLKSGRVPVSGDPRCFTPETLKGISLVSLSAANLTCPDMTTMDITTYETNSSPLKEGNFLVITYVSLCLLFKTIVDF
ncbi:peroxidasin-like [Saccostrea cucullata]|uniref:peroxidasin-like n=1 Tax=Saccostrea cuccullata TaxID=36930 RepID=UPI002ED5EA56